MRATRITVPVKVERALREIAEGNPSTAQTTARLLIARIDDSRRLAERRAKLPPMDVLRIIKNVMGALVSMPPYLGRSNDRFKYAPLLSLIKNRVSMLGLEHDDIETVAFRALQRCQLPVAIDWLIANMERMLLSDEEYDQKYKNNGVQPEEGRVMLGLPSD